MSMRVLTWGIDSLYFSVRAPVRPEAWKLLTRAKERAEFEREPALVEFQLTGQAFMVKPHGWRGYTFWATSPDYELMVGRSERFPPVYVQMHSAYLHSMGVAPALHLVELFLRHELLALPAELVVSRLDIHCDYQGWDPEIEDIRRFVCRGRGRRVHVQHEEAFAHGRRLTGFTFGRGALSARLYDKTLQAAQRGLTWGRSCGRAGTRACRCGVWSSRSSATCSASSTCARWMRRWRRSRICGSTGPGSG